MNATRLLRPSQIVVEVVEQHAVDAAFLWHLRDLATESPRHSRADLDALSRRVRAHLEGLRIAGEEGWELARAELESESPGAVFSCAATAILQRRLEWFEALVTGHAGDAASRRELVGALSFLPALATDPVMGALWHGDASRRALVFDAWANRRDPLPRRWRKALDDPSAALRASALRAAALGKKRSVIGRLRAHLYEETAGEARFYAAVASTVLSGDQDGPRVLQRFALLPGRQGRLAVKLALLASDPAEARRFRNALAQDAQTQAQAIIATGMLGDIDLVPWLIDQMRVPELARQAGEAFATLTGIALLEGGLDAPDGEDEPPSGEALLPLPRVDAVELAWRQWRRNKADGVAGRLFGERLTRKRMVRIFETGRQSQRAIAALALAVSSPTARWPEHRA
ncbi:MAG TPA: hypothetical protein VIG99_09705 [Myxococcaceae bacterium]